jgi:hypothetical protein
MQTDTFNGQEPEPGPDSAGSGPGTSLLVLPGPPSHSPIASPEQQ